MRPGEENPDENSNAEISEIAGDPETALSRAAGASLSGETLDADHSADGTSPCDRKSIGPYVLIRKLGEGGTAGVGRATIMAFVASSLVVLIADLFITRLLLYVFQF